MRTFSYTISAQLRSNLLLLDEKRIQLLIIPLSPKTELRFRWETTLDRIYYSFMLSNIQIRRKEISNTISLFSSLKKPKKLTSDERIVLKYKKALDLITQNWLVTDKTLTPKIIVALHEIGANGSYRKKDSDLKQILDYVQTAGDHPAVQAAIIYAAIMELRPFADGNQRIARLLSLLFLYKKGFDVRGLVCIEKEWWYNQNEFKNELNQGINSAHMTVWIEYFTRCLINQLSQKLQEIKSQEPLSATENNFFALTERQKSIFSLLEEPNTNITNRIVQKHFSISQITASRDLARLATLGLLIPHGRGRSIYYTKA